MKIVLNFNHDSSTTTFDFRRFQIFCSWSRLRSPFDPWPEMFLTKCFGWEIWSLEIASRSCWEILGRWWRSRRQGELVVQCRTAQSRWDYWLIDFSFQETFAVLIGGSSLVVVERFVASVWVSHSPLAACGFVLTRFRNGKAWAVACSGKLSRESCGVTRIKFPNTAWWSKLRSSNVLLRSCRTGNKTKIAIPVESAARLPWAWRTRWFFQFVRFCMRPQDKLWTSQLQVSSQLQHSFAPTLRRKIRRGSSRCHVALADPKC